MNYLAGEISETTVADFTKNIRQLQHCFATRRRGTQQNYEKPNRHQQSS